MELTAQEGGQPAAGFSSGGKADFWIGGEGKLEKPVHIHASHLQSAVDEWTSIFSSERLTGTLLDRLTHHVHILEMNGESYRLATPKKAQRHSAQERSQNPKMSDQGDHATKI